ncbi:BCL2 associated agonist of cell death b isoform X2 [Astyanax mexicanus]|uniref:BCL2 associated agonist of cell death b isoform X2 n=1 Tax=Astyanax mexicanus TaxID=7994 RepID=UPI0020CAE13C|nr:BCL2 associated agonist of cell death b isoform X2 [Astyanax mexicanus]
MSTAARAAAAGTCDSTAVSQPSKLDFTMDHMFTISDESDASEELGDSDQPEVSKTAEPSRSGQHITVPEKLREPRQRNFSMNEEALQESGAGRHEDGAGDGDSFRRRSRSAPPSLWAAKKYGRQLRKMSDEFDKGLEQGMKRVRSAGAARQMQNSPSWFAFLWSHKESDSEASSSRPAE